MLMENFVMIFQPKSKKFKKLQADLCLLSLTGSINDWHEFPWDNKNIADALEALACVYEINFDNYIYDISIR